MKTPLKETARPAKRRQMVESELLLLPSGQLLVHNLTPAMACLLEKLDPDSMRARASTGKTKRQNEGNH